MKPEIALIVSVAILIANICMLAVIIATKLM